MNLKNLRLYATMFGILAFCSSVMAQDYKTQAIQVEQQADVNAQKSYLKKKAYSGYLAAYRLYVQAGKNCKQNRQEILTKISNLMGMSNLLMNSERTIIDSLLTEAGMEFGQDTKYYLPLMEQYVLKPLDMQSFMARKFEFYNKSVVIMEEKKMTDTDNYAQLLDWCGKKLPLTVNNLLSEKKDTVQARNILSDYAKKMEKKYGKNTEKYFLVLESLERTYPIFHKDLIPIIEEEVSIAEKIYGKDDERTKAKASYLSLLYSQSHQMSKAIEVGEKKYSNSDPMQIMNQAINLVQYGKLREANEQYMKLLENSIANPNQDGTYFYLSVIGITSNLLTLKDANGIIDFAKKYTDDPRLTYENRDLIFSKCIDLASLPGYINKHVLDFVSDYVQRHEKEYEGKGELAKLMEAKVLTLYGMLHFDETISELDNLLKKANLSNDILSKIKYTSYQEICFLAKKDMQKAMAYNEKVINMLKTVPNYKKMAEFRSALCRACFYQDYLANYASLSPLIKEIIEIQDSVTTILKPSEGLRINSFATLYQLFDKSSISSSFINSYIHEGCLDEAKKLVSKDMENMESTIYFTLSQLNKSEEIGKNGYMKKLAQELNLIAALQPNDTELAQKVFDYCLLYKQAFLAASSKMKNQIMESADKELIAKFNEMQKIQNDILTKEEKGVDVTALKEELIQLETQVRMDSKLYGDYIKELHFKWKDIKKQLADDDAVVEFFSYSEYLTKTQKLGAVLLRKNWDSPRIITLCKEAELAADETFNPDKIGLAVWQPILDKMGEVKNIYFSPSGGIYNLPIENAKLDGTYLTSSYKIQRISSSRVLCQQGFEKGKEAYLIGGIEYRLTNKELSSKDNSETQSTTEILSLDKVRGAMESLPYLEGTKEEVIGIKEILSKDSKLPIHIYLGKEALENSIKTIKPYKAKLLHIATHGFYMPQDKTENNIAIQLANLNREDNSLMRSGLYMAGSQNTLNGDAIPVDIDDGILTSQEISALDLRGLDLVVLSACETAKGDIASDGIFGLQRGFKKAGVNSILMSLWKVSDQATSKLMTFFYTNLTEKKMTKYEALEAAKKKIRETKGWENPKYWASFILLDGIK